MQKNVAGFTLVELLVVIGIVGILATILVPSLINARVRASDMAAKTYTRNIANYLASADMAAETPVARAALQAINLCTDALLIAEGADPSMPDFVDSCAISYNAGIFTITVVSKVSGDSFSSYY